METEAELSRAQWGRCASVPWSVWTLTGRRRLKRSSAEHPAAEQDLGGCDERVPDFTDVVWGIIKQLPQQQQPHPWEGVPPFPELPRSVI